MGGIGAAISFNDGTARRMLDFTDPGREGFFASAPSAPSADQEKGILNNGLGDGSLRTVAAAVDRPTVRTVRRHLGLFVPCRHQPRMGLARDRYASRAWHSAGRIHPQGMFSVPNLLDARMSALGCQATVNRGRAHFRLWP